MTRAPTLDSFGEIYRGFRRDRELVRAWIVDADEEWLRAFEDLRRTRDYYQSSDEVIAHEVMRILLSVIDAHVPRRRRRRWRRAE